jgi:aryl sulfotransferase
MTSAQPERSHVYKGVLTDGMRWDGFVHRPGDIFVCTSGKNGTTWMQAICALLVFGRPDIEFNPAAISPWIDAVFEPIDEVLAMLEAQTHRRVIKTHTPLDGIPFFDDCSYVCVYRDPRDVYFSMRNHVDNMKLELLADRVAEDPQEGFRAWTTASFAPGESESFSLAALVHHYDSFRAFEHLPNIHIFHYSDLKRDLAGGMGRVAEALGVEAEPALLVELAETASFDNMRKNAERFAPGADRDVWHDTARFFNKGDVGQWRDGLTGEDVELFEKSLNALLPAERARWMLHGSEAP